MALGGKWVSGFSGTFMADLVTMSDFMAWQPRKLFELSGPQHPALESDCEEELTTCPDPRRINMETSACAQT